MMRPHEKSCLADSSSANAAYLHSQQTSLINPALEKLAGAHNLLMLQGPVGPLFDRIANWKKRQGGQAMRIIFNAGDALFSHVKPKIKYQGTLDEWPQYFRKLVQQHGFDAVILFGQSRRYHTCAVAVCRALGIRLIVMEEGYIRPGYITLELEGVNGFSTTLRHYRVDTSATAPTNKPAKVSYHLLWASIYAGIYYVAMAAGTHQFAHYQHHRDKRLLPHCLHWTRTAAMKLLKLRPDAKRVETLLHEAQEQGVAYFFIPLQLDVDAQIVNHSHFNDCAQFLQTVLRSFAIHAPLTARLVIKQHPLAKGSRKTEKFVREFSGRLGISARVIFLYEAHIPTLIKNAAGIVTINSTVGLQAIYQCKPLKVLGTAIYEKHHVTDSKSLNRFWRFPMQPDATAAALLYRDIKSLTQVPAAIYASRRTDLDWQGPQLLLAASTGEQHAGS